MSIKQRMSEALMQSPLWHRWQRLAPRERLSLALLGAFLLLVVCYVALWQPAQRQLADARAYFEEQRELHAYLERNTDLARSLARDNRPTLPPEQLQGVVTQTAQQRDLRIESFDLSGDGSLQVSLPGASYSLLLYWLDELQGQGVYLRDAALQRAGDGRVDARLTFSVEG
ncbi:type II secretion system protein M [Stutzerimonas urumqiensis]|uniref:type II secretion system protein M n=1 Tax=Stutzerimonas urumqiensis TaxID=638269 RepID=UPI003DA451B2